ncbi:MAG: FAD-dependent oxidoreductase [Candidatus Abyssobacteria bacterium SURF_17]|uniref:FAD-dependent oxidoreductase n=1 Tax=Candidatus Abyssobacteria bacterium SURF_17 TaxID=2093361 RepID=A0A419F2U6_9BACT|nr:MAG: FAD-dependent oxidoreductase [Candidatus Abyssubacteria bacterium SURF_17]
MENRKVVIIGAGIGGLSAGYWLSQRGYDVEIFEALDRPGGRMATIEHKGDKVDVGAQFFHSNYRYAFDLIDAMNLRSRLVEIKGKVKFAFSDGATGVFIPHSFFIQGLGLAKNLKLYRFMLKHIILAHRPPMYRIEEANPEFDDMEALEAFEAPKDLRLRDVISSITLASNMSEPEWMSLYHFIALLRIDMFTHYYSMVGGISMLAEELAKHLSIRYETPVRQLVMDKGRVVGVQLDKDGSVKRAGHVIVAAAARSVGRLLPDELAQQREFFNSITQAPLPMPVFFLDRPVSRDLWAYFNEPGLKRTFSFVEDHLVKCPAMIPSGKGVVSAWSCYPHTLDLVDRPDEEIIKQALSDIEPILPGVSSWVDEARVFWHKEAGMGHYPPGSYRKVLDFKQKARELRGVSFVSDILGGCFMEAAMVSAAEAVRRVCGWGGTAY